MKEQELLRLNQTILFTYIDLTRTLASPVSAAASEYARKLEALKGLFFNMHHLINVVRPFQVSQF